MTEKEGYSNGQTYNFQSSWYSDGITVSPSIIETHHAVTDILEVQSSQTLTNLMMETLVLTMMS